MTDDKEIEALAERLRDLLNDCWDAGVQVVHHAEMDGHCQGDYTLRADDETSAGVDVRWYPLVERWGVA